MPTIRKKKMVVIPVDLIENESVSFQAIGLYAFIEATTPSGALNLETSNRMRDKLMTRRSIMRQDVDELIAAGHMSEEGRRG